MKLKWIKYLAFLCVMSLFLSACSNKKEDDKDKNENKKQTVQGVDFDKIYNMEDDKVLLEIDGKGITVKEIKKATFEQGLLNTINHFVDDSLLEKKYTVTDEEVENEIKNRKKAFGKESKNMTFDKNEVRKNLSYNKAIRALDVQYTEDDYKQIYEQYYKGHDKRTFEELKEEIKNQAPYILGGQHIQELQKELRKTADVKYNEESLKKEFSSKK